MRNPFEIKNSILDETRNVEGHGGIDFEEGANDQTHENMERLFLIRPKYQILWWFGFLMIILLLGRLYQLTVVSHEELLAIAEGNRLRIEHLPAPRGLVYDKNGEVLAGNRPSFELVATPLDLPSAGSEERARIVRQVAEILRIPEAEIEQIIAANQQQSFESVLISQNLSREQALIFHEQISGLPGFRVVNTPIRDYHDAEAFAHLLGYVGKITREEYEQLSEKGYLFNDSVGKTSLEGQYEDQLRGIFGERQVEVDARGLVKKTYGEKTAQPGDNLILNIDGELQRQIYELLSAQLAVINKKRAAAIAMDPRDGRILAMVSLPSFDNNLFAEGISSKQYQQLVSDSNQPLFNRAIRGTYPPGSTVKPMVALAALQEGIVSAGTVIDDQGYIVIRNIYGGPDSYFYGYNRRALGNVDVKTAIARSSDIFFYIMGGGYDPIDFTGLGIERLAKYYKMFRLDSALGIDLPGEASGLVPTPEWKRDYFGEGDAGRWFLGNTYHVSIGQGDLLATPLHVLSWTASIANGGKIYKPLIVSRVEDSEGNIKQAHSSEIIGELDVDPQYLSLVREGMRQTVTGGTAILLDSLSVPVAGKTGSAQFDARDLSRSHAWFSGYAPADDPQIALVILIEDGGTGAGESVPVARKVLQWWIENRYVHQ